MALFFVALSHKEPGPLFIIRCPKCGADGVEGAAYRQVDDLCLFYVLKLFTVRNTFVECLHCRATLHSSVDLDELAQYRHGEWNQFLSHDVSFVVKFLAIASALLCIAPFLGIILALITVLLTLRSSGWTPIVARAALLLSIAITGLLILFDV